MDAVFAVAKTQFISEAKLRAERRGDLIVITGEVEHVWSDPYNFEKGGDSSYTDLARTAEAGGRARSYPRGSGWTQSVRGTARIVDGKLTDFRLEWEDTGERVDWQTWTRTMPSG